jgi:acetoin utilization deacetylase AcuC-like enzyme
MPQTAVAYHPACLDHDAGPGHPERPERLRGIMDRLAGSGLLARVLSLTPEPATLEAIARVHDREYVADVCNRSGPFQAGPDTAGSAGTPRAARLAAGAAIAAVDAVMRGDVRRAFCAVRPPGHHAERGEARGFCFFNTIAIAARHLQAAHGVDRVAIIDWDVHHGNGTQNAFYEDPSVFYASVHQYPLYPGSGRRNESGSGAGRGFTLNVPLASGSTDSDYARVFRDEFEPAVRRFGPQFVLVSAGFDAHQDDPLGGMLVSEQGFGEMTSSVLRMAAACSGRVVSILEGGYDIRATAAASEAHVRALMEG